jgi:hypothetical protein
MRILSHERLLEYIEKLRATLPDEVGRAKMISSNKDRVIRDAQQKAQEIVTEAAAAQAQLVDQTDILRQARTTAEVVLREAEERANKIREGADNYAQHVLAELEGRLGAALGSIKKGKEALEPRSVAVQPAQTRVLAEAAAKSKRAAFDSQADAASRAESIEVTS